MPAPTNMPFSMLMGVDIYGPNDENMYKLAMSVLRGEHAWLEQGIASGDTEMGQAAGEEAEPVKYDETRRVMAGV